MDKLFDFVVFNKKTGPKILMLSPTDYCNLHCKICWRLKKGATFHQPSFSFFKKIIKEAGEIHVEIIDLTGGGEPFVRKDILKIMKLVKSQGIKGIMTTNGTLLRKYHINQIVKMGWDEINFSLDGSKPKINDYIRGEGVFKKVISTIKTFNEVKKDRNSEKPIERLSFVITRKNLEDIPNYIRLANKLDIKAINFSVLFEWPSNKEFWIRGIPKNKVVSILKQASSLAKKLKIRTNLDSVITYGLSEHEPPKFCFAPWYMLFINASREAMACCTLATLYQNLLGKVDSLHQVWYSKKMKNLRKRMKKRKFFKACRRCLPEFTKMFNDYYKEMKTWSSKKL